MMMVKAIILSLVHPSCGCMNSSSPKFRNLNFSAFHFRRRRTILSLTAITCSKSNSNDKSARSERIGFSYQRRKKEPPDVWEDVGSGAGGWTRRRSEGRWWSDDAKDEMYDMVSSSSSEILDEVIESIWIFKVFKSFGYMLPLIILSILIATGPKAFLASIGILVMPSILYLAVEKTAGKDKSKQGRRKPKTNGRVFPGAVNNVEEDEVQTRNKSSGKRQPPRPGSRVNSINGGVNHYQNHQGAKTFGGWEDLVEPVNLPPERSSPTTQRHMDGEKKERRETEMPLLVRLLVAVFPVLGAWTKMW